MKIFLGCLVTLFITGCIFAVDRMLTENATNLLSIFAIHSITCILVIGISISTGLLLNKTTRNNSRI
jgi:hypothetical protein